MLDLSTVHGSSATKYVINVAKKLFSNEELKGSMLSPQKTVKSRPPLSPNRSEKLKGLFVLLIFFSELCVQYTVYRERKL